MIVAGTLNTLHRTTAACHAAGQTCFRNQRHSGA